MIIRAIGFVLLISTMILGNTYYIDYAGGSDGNGGTSKSAPWKRCPGMNGFTATYTHAAGDVFIFKGNVVWPAAALPFTIAYSGSATNTDVYTTDHSWYAGSVWAQPTFDGQLFQKTLLYASEKSYIRINDLRLINAGMAAANGIIAFTFSNCSYIELSNNTLAPQSWGCLYVITERTGDFNDIFIHHNDISACAFGMRFVPGAAKSFMHNVQVYNNNIHDFKSQLSGAVHGDGIQCYNTPDVAASYDRYIDGFKIFNNHFYGDFSQVAGSGGAMTALIYLSGASQGVEIYNNLFAPKYSGTQSPNFFESFISLRDNPNRGGHHKIYNNTFVTPVPGGQAAAIIEDDTRYPAPALDIKNNIFSNFNWPFDLRSTNHTIDYNNDYFVRDIGKWAGNFVGSFAKWQALGHDVHGISANPGFVSSTDFRLSQNSPCIGKGANLSTVVTTDINGNARPGLAGYSQGAYEFGTAAATLLPSTIVLWWPGNASSGIVINPSLTWSPEPGALSYAVQVSADSAFTTPIIKQTAITTADFEANGLLYASTYYWRVNVTKANGTSGWSRAAKFTTAKAPSNAFLQDLSANGIVSIEAEHYMANVAQNAHSWGKVSKTGFSGEGAMQVLPNNGANINTGYAANSPRMDFLVNFNKAGKHYIWARGLAASGSDDSYHAGIDGTEAATCDQISYFTGQWKWSKTAMDASAAYFNVSVAGEHTINIWMREDGFIIDKIVITTNLNYVPTGSGPAESFISGLKKELVPAPTADIRHVSPAMDIYSCENGVVQISLPSATAYRLTIYSLSGQKVGTSAENIGSAGRNAVSLKNMNIPQGFYVMQLSAQGIMVHKKTFVTQ